MSGKSRPLPYWPITIVYWALVAFLAYMSIGLFATGDFVGGFGFAIFVFVVFFSGNSPSKWLQKSLNNN